MTRPSRLRPTLAALLLVLVTAATALGMPATPRPAANDRPAIEQTTTVDGVSGDDACALLSDADLRRATGAASVVSRTPGSQQSSPAGCAYQLQPKGEPSATWSVKVGVQPDGGSARLDQEISFGGVLAGAGIGDRAVQSTVVPSWSAVKGDVYVRVSVIALAGDLPRPQEDMARLLIFRIMARLRTGVGGPAASPSPTPEPVAPERALVERLRAPDFGTDQVAAAVELLARSGVATYARPEDAEPLVPVTEPASPLRLLSDQVRAMALEAWAGGGFSGADLDALAPAPSADLAGGADILTGYVEGADTEGARVSRLLMGPIDAAAPGAAVFPQLVLMLMVSDVARDTLASAAATGHVGPRPIRAVALALTRDARTAAAGACSAVTGFIDGAIAAVFDALKAHVPDGGPGEVVVTIWNFVVGVAASVARTIVKELTQRVLDIIADVAGAVGLAAMVVSAIRPWTLAVSAEPPVTAKGSDGAPGQPGQLLVRVDVGGLDDWPAIVKDCADAARRPLPSLKPEGAPVTWTAITQGPVPLVAEGGHEATLDAQGIARVDFTTLTEDVPKPREEQAGRISVTVTVERPELDRLRSLATDQLLGLLPPVVRPILTPWLAPIIASVTAQLGHLISSQRSGSGWVIYHTPATTPEPGESPGPPEPATRRAVMVTVDRPARTGELAGTIIELSSCEGPYGDWSGVLRFGGIVAPSGFVAPFADIPVAFSFPGAGGIQTTRTTFKGDVPTNVSVLTAHIEGVLDVAVDGDTMSISGRVLQANLSDRSLRDLPIEAAPEGTCP